MRITVIAAIGLSGQLGENNQLLWHHSNDLKNFKKVTKGHAILMGRKTYESIGKPLPLRINIVISRQPEYLADGASTFTSIDDGISFAKESGNSELFIIGGGTIYEQSMKKAHRLYITHVEYNDSADTFFPKIDPQEFTIVNKESLEGNPAAYIATYEARGNE